MKKPGSARPVKKALEIGENGVALHFLGQASMRARKNKVCVLSPGSFSDNSKYIYAYLYSNLKKIDPSLELYWLCHSPAENEELRAAGVNSFLFSRNSGVLQRLIETRYVFVSTHHLAHSSYCYMQVALSGATKIQMWHGVPAKHIGYQLLSKQPPNRFAYFSYDCLSADYVTAESEFVRPRYQEAFPNADVLVTGSPRTDILLEGGDDIPFSEINTDQAVIAQMRGVRQNGGRAVLYCPTFRAKIQDRSGFLQEIRKFIEGCAKDENCLLVIKNHKISIDTPDIREMVQALDTTRVLIVDPSGDIYPYLREAEVLVTDYSSIYYDYLLTGRRIVFFQPDREVYLEIRDIYDERDVSGYEVGEYVIDGADCAALLKASEDPKYAADREKLTKLIFKYDKSSSCERVLDRVIPRH